MSLISRELRDYHNNASFFTVLLNQNDIINSKGAFENAVTISSYTPTQEFSDKFRKNMETYCFSC